MPYMGIVCSCASFVPILMNVVHCV